MQSPAEEEDELVGGKWKRGVGIGDGETHYGASADSSKIRAVWLSILVVALCRGVWGRSDALISCRVFAPLAGLLSVGRSCRQGFAAVILLLIMVSPCR